MGDQSDQANQLLLSTQLADELQIPQRTLDQWAYLGRGPRFVRVGRHRRYRRKDIDDWLEAQTRGGERSS